MKLYGYSERGMVYSLCIELLYSNNRNDFLKSILNSVTFFKDKHKGFPDFNDFDVYIEQSFSDFGDSDLLIILKKGTTQIANIFFEAKVNAAGKKTWNYKNELNSFIAPKDKLNSSNMFTQLFHKMMMIENNNLEKLKNGVEAPPCSTKAVRKIGDNPIIHKMIEQFAPKSEKSFYIGLVPLNDDAIKSFKNYFNKNDNVSYDFWNSDNLGLINYRSILELVGKDSIYGLNYDRNEERLSSSK